MCNKFPNDFKPTTTGVAVECKFFLISLSSLDRKLLVIFFEEIRFSMKILSMGLSDDYKLAIENGSNMIRLGSSIFGSRN